MNIEEKIEKTNKLLNKLIEIQLGFTKFKLGSETSINESNSDVYEESKSPCDCICCKDHQKNTHYNNLKRATMSFFHHMMRHELEKFNEMNKFLFNINKVDAIINKQIEANEDDY